MADDFDALIQHLPGSLSDQEQHSPLPSPAKTAGLDLLSELSGQVLKRLSLLQLRCSHFRQPIETLLLQVT